MKDEQQDVSGSVAQSPLALSGAHAARAELGRLVRLYREALGIDQSRLAELAGLGTKQAVSALERGDRDVKAFELSRLARTLHVSMDVLLGVTPPAPAQKVLWRRRIAGRPTANGADERLQSRNAQLRERAERYALLEAWCGATAVDALPDFDIDVKVLTYAKASELAGRVARQLDLGSVPAASLEQTLADQFGVKIFHDALGVDGEASAACIRDDDVFGCAVLLNSDEPPVRRAFSLAHELFHLVTWTSVAEAWHVHDDGRQGQMDGDEPTWFQQLERCAQSFAAALLIPADRVMAELERRARRPGEPRGSSRPVDCLRPSDYAFMAHVSFRVSTDALLWRLVNLGQLSKGDRDALARHPELITFNSRMSERDAARGAVFPERYWELVRLAYENGEAGLAKLAEFAEMRVDELYELLTAALGDAGYEASVRESTEAAAV